MTQAALMFFLHSLLLRNAFSSFSLLRYYKIITIHDLALPDLRGMASPVGVGLFLRKSLLSVAAIATEGE